MSELQAEKLSYRYDGRLLVDDVSLSLSTGEMVTLIGPNGAGKSTLLRLLTGFLPASAGSCRLAGKPLTCITAAELARQRAVMRQQHNLSFPMQAVDVVALGRAPWSSVRREEIIYEVMTLTGALPLARRDYRQLSGGEQQRVQLARVLAQLWHDDGPQGWLFLDEPTSALDLFYQQQTLRLLHQLTRKGNLMVCAVLHDLNLAALWSDRLLLMSQGKLVATGSAEEVITEPVLTRWYRADLSVITARECGRPQVQLNQ